MSKDSSDQLSRNEQSLQLGSNSRMVRLEEQVERLNQQVNSLKNQIDQFQFYPVWTDGEITSIADWHERQYHER